MIEKTTVENISKSSLHRKEMPTLFLRPIKYETIRKAAENIGY